MDLVPHPAADLFPMLSERDLQMMADDIKANGQAVPIAILNGTYIIDGRNRYAACRLAGVEPKTREMQSDFADEGEVIRFIISTNIHRRHLTESQRAAIAAELAKLGRGGDRSKPQICGLTQAQAAEQMQVSERMVNAAKAIQRDAPDLAAKVKSGEIKVSRAAAMAKERAKPQTDPDLAADSVIDATEARHAEGDTPRARKLLSALADLDDTERTFIRDEVLRMLGVIR